MTSATGQGLMIEQLATGDADPVLVADFPTGSAAPRISDLLSVQARGRSVYRIDPLAALSGDRPYIPLSQLATGYADAFASSDPADGHVYVVGHCSCAGLSLRITGLLAASRQVSAVLLLPTWPGTDDVAEKFAEFQANLGAALQPCPDLDPGPDGSISRMEHILRDQMAAAADSRGLPASTDAFLGLLVWYRAWLAFLLACRDDPPIALAAGSATVTVLTSSPADIRVPGMEPGSYRICPAPAPERPDEATADLAQFALTQISGG